MVLPQQLPLFTRWWHHSTNHSRRTQPLLTTQNRLTWKLKKLYRNDIYMMRKLNTASEEYIESFNKSYYHNYNCCPLKPVHCSGMFVRRLCCGADLYLTCFLIFLKHRFICINTSSISRFVTKMECLNCPFPWFASGGGTKFF